MFASMTLVAVLALAGAEPAQELAYSDYREAWTVAKEERLPLLVVLNPARDADEVRPIDLAEVHGTRHRKQLLSRYIVVEVDCSTEAGKDVLQRFGTPSLPHVAVIDRDQKYVLSKTSDKLSPEDWNLILEKHRTGDYTPIRVVSQTVVSGSSLPYSGCTSCQQNAMRFYP